MSSLETRFKSSATVKFAPTTIAFINAAKESPKNSDLISGNPDGPHKFFYINSDTGPKEFFYIQEPDGEISAVIIAYASSLQKNDMYLMGLSVLPDFRQNGYAQSLLLSVFSKAQAEDRLIIASDFTNLGWKYLAPMMTEMHKNFPAVKIRYNGIDEGVTGFLPYRLEQDHGITRVVSL
jgi:hypothetical protein